MKLEDLRDDRKLEVESISQDAAIIVIAAGILIAGVTILEKFKPTEEDQQLKDSIDLIKALQESTCYQIKERTYQCEHLEVQTDFSEYLIVRSPDKSSLASFSWQSGSNLINIQVGSEQHYLCPLNEKCYDRIKRNEVRATIDIHPKSILHKLKK